MELRCVYDGYEFVGYDTIAANKRSGVSRGLIGEPEIIKRSSNILRNKIFQSLALVIDSMNIINRERDTVTLIYNFDAYWVNCRKGLYGFYVNEIFDNYRLKSWRIKNYSLDSLFASLDPIYAECYGERDSIKRFFRTILSRNQEDIYNMFKCSGCALREYGVILDYYDPYFVEYMIVEDGVVKPKMIIQFEESIIWCIDWETDLPEFLREIKRWNSQFEVQ